METAVMFIQPISFLYVGSPSLYIMFTIFEGESVQ